MKVNINRHKKIQQLRKTHNLYLYSKGNKVYYKAIPKRNVEVIQEKRNYFWPVLTVLAIVLCFVAKGLNNKPETHAEDNAPAEVMEVIVDEETTESVREITAEEPYSGVCAEWYDLVAQYEWDVNIVLSIMKAESNCNPEAVNYNTNGTVDTGLMQLNSAYWKQTLDPAENIEEAYRVYTRSGNRFTPWVVYNTGKYLEFL